VPKPKNTPETFWARVRKGDGCWEWTGGRDPDYGSLSYQGKKIRAHVLAWKLTYGDTNGKCVLHKCDNPPCCRPDHLFLGSRSDNSRDKVLKLRQPKGEKISSSKLTYIQVNAAREAYRQKLLNIPELARAFQVDTSTLAKVIRREFWTEKLDIE